MFENRYQSPPLIIGNYLKTSYIELAIYPSFAAKCRSKFLFIFILIKMLTSLVHIKHSKKCSIKKVKTKITIFLKIKKNAVFQNSQKVLIFIFKHYLTMYNLNNQRLIN